jgi:hypothetical protein
MTPPRHALVHIPSGRGLTRANLNRLRILNTAHEQRLNTYDFNNAQNILNDMNVIYDRIARNGGHASRAAARNFARPYINRLRGVRGAARTLRSDLNSNVWRRVLNAAGRFKKGGMTRIQLKELVKVLGGGHNAHTMASLVRTRVSPGSPLTTRRRNYNASVRREEERVARRAANVRRRESAARHAEQLAVMRRPSPPRATTTTRSGRSSRKPRN